MRSTTRTSSSPRKKTVFTDAKRLAVNGESKSSALTTKILDTSHLKSFPVERVSSKYVNEPESKASSPSPALSRRKRPTSKVEAKSTSRRLHNKAVGNIYTPSPLAHPLSSSRIKGAAEPDECTRIKLSTVFHDKSYESLRKGWDSKTANDFNSKKKNPAFVSPCKGNLLSMNTVERGRAKIAATKSDSSSKTLKERDNNKALLLKSDDLARNGQSGDSFRGRSSRGRDPRPPSTSKVKESYKDDRPAYHQVRDDKSLSHRTTSDNKTDGYVYKNDKAKLQSANVTKDQRDIGDFPVESDTRGASDSESFQCEAAVSSSSSDTFVDKSDEIKTITSEMISSLMSTVKTPVLKTSTKSIVRRANGNVRTTTTNPDVNLLPIVMKKTSHMPDDSSRGNAEIGSGRPKSLMQTKDASSCASKRKSRADEMTRSTVQPSYASRAGVPKSGDSGSTSKMVQSVGIVPSQIQTSLSTHPSSTSKVQLESPRKMTSTGPPGPRPTRASSAHIHSVQPEKSKSEGVRPTQKNQKTNPDPVAPRNLPATFATSSNSFELSGLQKVSAKRSASPINKSSLVQDHRMSSQEIKASREATGNKGGEEGWRREGGEKDEGRREGGEKDGGKREGGEKSSLVRSSSSVTKVTFIN